MYSSEDLERFYFQYQTEALPHGEVFHPYSVRFDASTLLQYFGKFYRKIKSQTIEPAKVGSKTLKRSLKCCQNEWLSMKKCAEKSGLIC